MTEQARPKSIRVLFAVLAIGTFPLALCGGLYSCSVAPRKATEAYFAGVRAGSAPYPLEPDDARDAEQTLRDVARSTGFSVWNFHQRGTDEWTRTCLLVRLSLPEGGRWMDVALDQRGEEWRVRDVSFDRDCNTAKQGGDYRLHR